MTDGSITGGSVPEHDGDRWKREIGRYCGERPGPLLICIAGLHGNEPSGILALERVLATLRSDVSDFSGDLVGLAGNLGALRQGERFIDEDMNRVWSAERVEAVLRTIRESRDDPERPGTPLVGSAELFEQRELLAELDRWFDRARGPIYLLDLHTTSSPSAPFSTIGDTLANRALALELPIPLVLGLEEQIDGAMLEFFDHKGVIGIGVEGGSHEAPESVDAHEEALWLTLAAASMIPNGTVAAVQDARNRLAERARGLPAVVDVQYRHAIRPEDHFVMRPGFRNFDPVRKGDVVANDAAGPVRAPESGRMFMPLYQRLGDDGFFIVRSVRPMWLGVSRTLRSWGADRLAHLLPGVRRHPGRSDALVLSEWARHRPVVGLLHLLGFTLRRQGGATLMIRRAEQGELRH